MENHPPRDPAYYPGAQFLRPQNHEQNSNHHSRATSGYSNGKSAPDRVEEVWLKESQNRISYNDADLNDVARPAFNNPRVTLAGLGACAAMLALIGLLAVSSLPDLTPHDIISMQGYEGEQPIKTPFNLASLRDCDNAADCSSDSSDLPPVTANTDLGSPATTDSLAFAPEVRYDNSTPTIIESQRVYTELQEIPAATTTFSTDNGFNDTLEVPVSSRSTFDSEELIVLQQWSNVRDAPNTRGSILTSLAEGTSVTRLSQTGSWIEVRVNNRSQTIGYMHRSTVAGR